MRAKQVMTGGLLIALGVLLPMTSHITGVGGPVLLPMHIPILFAGILLGPGFGALVGMITPVISHLVTGMPAISPIPILPIMVVELAIYGWAIGYLYHHLKVNTWIALVGAMILGRLGMGLTAAAIGSLFNVPLNGWVYFQGAIITGLPGIALQFLIVPTLAQRLFLAQSSGAVAQQPTITS